MGGDHAGNNDHDIAVIMMIMIIKMIMLMIKGRCAGVGGDHAGNNNYDDAVIMINHHDDQS